MKFISCFVSLTLLYFWASSINHPRRSMALDTGKLQFPLGTPKEFIDNALKPIDQGKFEDTWIYFVSPSAVYYLKFDDEKKLSYLNFYLACIGSRKKTFKDRFLMKSQQEISIEIKQKYIDKIANKIQQNIQTSSQEGS